MRTLLVVHHTASPTLEELLDAVIAGATTDEISGVRVEVRPALSATASDVLAADGFILGTPANIGYMSGALKHFFDVVYYPILDDTRGLPYGLYVHGNLDTAGAITAVETIAGGLGWQRVAAAVEVRGQPDAAARAAVAELAATLAATVMPD